MMAETTDARSDTVRKTAVLLITVLSLMYFVVADAASAGLRDRVDVPAATSAARSTYHHSSHSATTEEDAADEQRSSGNCTQCGGGGVPQAEQESFIKSVKSHLLRELRLEHPPRNAIVAKLPEIIQRDVDKKPNEREARRSARGEPEHQYDDDMPELLLLSFPGLCCQYIC